MRNQRTRQTTGNDALLATYNLFDKTSRALIASLELLKHDLTNYAVAAISLLLISALRLSIRNLRLSLRNADCDGSLAERVTYGYIARYVDLTSHIKDARSVARARKPQTVFALLDDGLRDIERELADFNAEIDYIIEKKIKENQRSE